MIDATDHWWKYTADTVTTIDTVYTNTSAILTENLLHEPGRQGDLESGTRGQSPVIFYYYMLVAVCLVFINYVGIVGRFGDLVLNTYGTYFELNIPQFYKKLWLTQHITSEKDGSKEEAQPLWQRLIIDNENWEYEEVEDNVRERWQITRDFDTTSNSISEYRKSGG